MRKCAFLLTGGLAILTYCHVLAGDAGEQKKLQGTWELTELVVGGSKAPEKDVQGMKFVFKADELTIMPPPTGTGVVEKRTFKVKLDPKKNPAEVDLTALDGEFKGTTSPGIYEVKGDTLRWCQSDDEKSKDRPKALSSPDKSRIYLFTLKRAK